MGVIIPLFDTYEPNEELDFSNDERLKLKLIRNSIEALKKEEKNLEFEISEKCKDEIEQLNSIDRKLYQLETEIEVIYKNKKKTNQKRR